MLLSVALALAGNLATNTLQVDWPGWPYLVWTLVVVLVGATLAAERRQHRLSDARDRLAQAAEDLAARALKRSSDHPQRKRLNQSLSLRVRFSSQSGPGAADREMVLGETGTDWSQHPLHGELDEIVEVFRALPHRQLVVTGDPGAGKSILALLLTHRLLDGHRRGEPVPVLLSISSWDPQAETVNAFVARRLAEDFAIPAGEAADLLDAVRPGQGPAGRYWVMPVLDGLDELPEKWRAKALTRLEGLASADRPLVVTCRSREYRAAVGAAGALARAAVVGLEPLAVADAVKFLSSTQSERTRWKPVLDHLGEQPRSVLARVLTTPLMVSMARGTFLAPNTDPTELLGLSTRDQITGRLIDQYVRTAYAGDGSTAGGRSGRGYQPYRAVGWLRTLAYHMYLSGSRDLRWWRLEPGLLSARPVATGRWWRAGFAVLAAGLAAIVGAWSGGPGMAAAASAVALLGIGVGWTGWFAPLWPTAADTFHSGETPSAQWLRVRLGRRGLHMVFGLVVGGAAGILSAGLWTGLLAGLLTGVAAGVIGVPDVAARGRRRPAGPLTDAAVHRIASLTAAWYGVGAGGVFVAVAMLTAQPHPVRQAVTAAVVFGVTAGLGAGWWAWISFQLAHLHLAMQGKLPWPLFTFLRDAYDLGLLRHNGTMWQFRHALIHDRLYPPIRTEHLRRQADAGDGDAAGRLAELLHEQGNTDELRRRADTGDGFAAGRLADLLHEQGNTDEAIAVLRPRADAGDGDAALQLADLLPEQGNTDEAIAVLRRYTDAGNGFAAGRLADLLHEQGNTDEAIAVLRPRADVRDRNFARRLANLLREQGNTDELRRRADAGDGDAAERLADLLHEQGNTDEAIAVLRPRADAGDGDAAQRLANLLREQGNTDELRRRADAGDGYAAGQLADLLHEQGNTDELRRRADAGDDYAAGQLADLLHEQGNTDEAIAILRPLADTNDKHAAWLLTGLLREQGNTDELRRRADAGALYAAGRLAELLHEQGNTDEAIAILRPLADADNWHAVEVLVELLHEQGNSHEAITILRRYADSFEPAVWQLAELLHEQGNTDEG
ncbi:tetratricopeptide repeat protein [Micromonospora sp. NPDC007230]|uniref:tetratricopeptide repeat protein n=1 Tax=Micromonospora sp. NPDC007230 TaxID=3364237 RepID=UPI0036CC3F19